MDSTFLEECAVSLSKPAMLEIILIKNILKQRGGKRKHRIGVIIADVKWAKKGGVAVLEGGGST